VWVQAPSISARPASVPAARLALTRAGNVLAVIVKILVPLNR
jgi:hypothetical protein